MKAELVKKILDFFTAKNIHNKQSDIDDAIIFMACKKSFPDSPTVYFSVVISNDGALIMFLAPIADIRLSFNIDPKVSMNVDNRTYNYSKMNNFVEKLEETLKSVRVE